MAGKLNLSKKGMREIKELERLTMNEELEELKKRYEELCTELRKKNEQLERENFGMKVTISNLKKKLANYYKYYN